MRHSLIAAAVMSPLFILAATPVLAQDDLATRVAAAAEAVNPQVIEWRRDIHANPELGFAETRTAALVAEHLRGLGMEVRTEVGKTGVVGVLRGGQPGRVVALRADMDALPVRRRRACPSPRPPPEPIWTRPCRWPTPAATTPMSPC